MNNNSKPVILIADDSELYTQALGELFKDSFQINKSTVSNEKLFLSSVAEHLPDIILYDIYMCPTNIKSLLKQVKEISKDSKVVALSYEIEEELIDFCLKAGFKGFIEKAKCGHELVIEALLKIAEGEIVVLTPQTV